MQQDCIFVFCAFQEKEILNQNLVVIPCHTELEGMASEWHPKKDVDKIGRLPPQLT